MRKGYRPELEGLRGVLAAWVMLYHAAIFGGFWKNVPSGVAALMDGARAVEVFMVLSGFVIAGLIWREREGYSVFLFRRFLRLYPIYLICIVVAALEIKFGIVAPHFDLSKWPEHLLAHILMLHGAISTSVLPGSAGAILNPAWSISLEWQFYIIAPILLYLRGPAGLVLASTVAVVLLRLVAPHLNGFTGAFLPLNIQFFWIGIITYAALERSKIEPMTVIFLTALCLLFLPVIVAVPIVLWVAAISPGPASRMLTSHILLSLGRWSLPIYLAHEPIIVAVRSMLPTLGPLKDTLLIVGIAGTLTVLVAAVLHRYVEAPFIVLGKRLKSRTSSESTPNQVLS